MWELIAGCIAPLALGAVAVGGYGYRRIRRWAAERSLAAQIRNTRLHAISEVPRDKCLVSVQGRSRPLNLVSSPLSGEAVIGYRIRIDFIATIGSSHREAKTIDVTHVDPFEVLDQTGIALVRPAGGIFLGDPRPYDPSQFAVDLTRPELERLILLQGFSTTDLVTATHLRVRQAVLRPAALVYVCGNAERVASANGVGSDYRHPPTRVVVSTGTERLIVADCERDLLLRELAERS